MAQQQLLGYIVPPMRYLILVFMVLLPLLAQAAAPNASSKIARSEADLKLASVSALVMDVESGETLYRKHDAVALPIASVTKVMTAMVALDAEQPLDEWLKIARWDNKFGKNAYSRLRIGSEAKRGELIRIALMSSENLATHVLAQNYPGGSVAFVNAMNAKAKELGMADTVFIDPAGLSPDNRSTARDLGRMAAAALSYPKIREYSTHHQHVVQFRNPTYTLPYGNTNPLVASERWDLRLTKTGYLTEAGRCLVMIAQIDAKPVVMVLLNSLGTRTPIGDAARVRRWLTTGEGGTVAGPALEYERRVSESLRRIDATAVGG
jgi:serine-type D-Ala-D-Ala endopeptidase (penicillin-binding protein 7)